jgi:hypothetical protein
MNSAHGANSLAAAFANAAARRTAQPSSPARTSSPSFRLVENNGTRLTPDELLLTVLRHNLTSADKIIARRILLRAAPWELCASDDEIVSRGKG